MLGQHSHNLKYILDMQKEFVVFNFFLLELFIKNNFILTTELQVSKTYSKANLIIDFFFLFIKVIFKYLFSPVRQLSGR